MLSLLMNQLAVLNAMLKREEGQDLIEYSLIIVVIVVAAVVGMETIGGNISDVFTAIGGWLSGYSLP